MNSENETPLSDLRPTRATLMPVWVCEHCLFTNVVESQTPSEETIREASGAQPWEEIDTRQWAVIPARVKCYSCEKEFRLRMVPGEHGTPEYPEDDDES